MQKLECQWHLQNAALGIFCILRPEIMNVVFLAKDSIPFAMTYIYN